MTQETPPQTPDPGALLGELFKGLGKRQTLFVKEYIKDENGKRAAIAAGYTEKGASTTYQRLLKEPDVQAAIIKLKQQEKVKEAYDLDAAVMQVEMLINEAREKNQYSAAAKLVELKTKLTGHYQEKMVMDLKTKGNFIVHMPMFKPPPYARDVIDVGVEKLIENAEKKK